MFQPSGPRWLTASLLLAALAFASTAFAGVHKVQPGEDVTLGPDEGLLLIAVDSTHELTSIRIERDGAVFGHGMLKGVDIGRTTQLFVAQIGRYRWKTATRGDLGWDLGDDDEYEFEVKPGVVNYPGDLIFRSAGGYRVTMDIANRGLVAIDWLQKEHPALWRTYGMAFTGHYPDPFPAAYHADRVDVLPDDKSAPVPASGPLPIAVETLWKPGALGVLEINAAGDLLAMVTTEPLAPAKPAVPASPVDGDGDKDEDEDGGEDAGSKRKTNPKLQYVVNLIDLKANASVRLMVLPRKVSRLDWHEDRTLLVSVGEDDEPDRVFVVQMTDAPGQPRRYERLTLPRRGILLDPVRGRPGYVLFLTRPTHHLRGGVQVHRVYIGDQQALDDFKYTMADQLDRGIENDAMWYADAQGRLRAVKVYDEEGYSLRHGIDGVYKEVYRFADADEEVFSPFALSADGNLFYGYAEKGRAQRELVEFDPATKTVGRTLFSRPGVDVTGALFDERKNLIGATYYENGIRIAHYFDDATARIDQRLRKAFPGRTVSILTRDAQVRNAIVAVGGSDKPVEVYHFDATTNTAALLQQSRPWLEGKRFAPAQVVHAKSKDGFDIESYLTLPAAAAGGAKVPLVVLSHGGPVGVRDTRSFDPEVQLIASLGYAVLQVNFRGSDGYGRAFADAGKGKFGTLIEDDIDAALAAALAAYPLDSSRMCAMGASYGGYSALVSAVRWPDRFKCVVSIAGISDRVLLFTASDFGGSEEGRKEIERIVGDPRTQLDEMIATSPLYHIDKLTVPVMIVHGMKDRRVDYEHARRLHRMLNRAGRPPVLVTMDDEGHGIESQAEIKRVYEGVAGFLRANLGQ
jgi:dipeptidyl aminopeptidase/acylaminoacyl peptidase